MRNSAPASAAPVALSCFLTIREPFFSLKKVSVCAVPLLMRMLLGVLSSTKPLTVFVSRAVTVVPGTSPEMVTRPFSSVM